VQHAQKADLRAQVFGIGRHLQKGSGRRAEEQFL
jgi:hypothetical protein